MRKQNENGLSLIELLVATGLIGIIMIGVVSVDYAARSAQNTNSVQSMMAMKASTMMLEISRNASLATGNFTDPGIISNSAADYHELCFRQDRNATITPDDLTDDVWQCYIMDNSFNLNRCTLASPPGGDPTSCTNAADHFILYESVTSFTSTFNTAPDLSVEFTVAIRKDRNQPANPNTNPEISVSTRVNPYGHSWQD